MTTALVPALLFALAAQGAAEEESAAPAHVVVVATGRTPALDAIAAEAEALARVALRARKDHVVVNATAPRRAPDAVLEEARALIAAGEEAYAELETKAAVENLERAVTVLTRELDRVGERQLLLRALALLGSVHHQSGHPKEAEKAFLTLLALSPTFSLDDGSFPPADVKLIERLQEDLAFTEPGGLKLLSGDVPASVWVDGKLRGVTPLELNTLEPGTHVWLIRRQGYEAEGGLVAVGGSPPAVATARLQAPAHDAELPSRIRGLVLERMNVHPTLDALGEALGEPDEVLAIVVEEDPKQGPRLKLVRALPASGVLVGYRDVAAGTGWQDRFLAALSELLDAPTTAELPLPAVAATPDLEPEVREEDDGAAGYWIAGAAGGLVLAAVVAGGAVLAFSSVLDDGGASSPSSATEDANALARRRVVLGF